MLLNKEKLTNGITLTTLKTDKFKTSVLSFTLTIPLSKLYYGYNHLLSFLLSRGTKSYPSTKSINKRVDEIYGSCIETKCSKLGENLLLTINAEILDNKYIPDGTDVLGEVINIVSELILSPAFIESDFNQEFFEQEKKYICHLVDSEINNAQHYASKRCSEIINEGIEMPTSHELKEIVTAATLNSVIEYHKYLIDNALLNVFYVGSQEENIVKEKISTAFSAYSCKTPKAIIAPKAITRDEALELSSEMPISQGKLAMGFSTGISVAKSDNSFYTALMLNEVFGGSAASKLFWNVRERLGLCYYCSSTFDGYSGIIKVSSGFEFKNYDIVCKTILQQLEDIKRGEISDTEFYAAQGSLINNYRQIFDSPFELMSFYRNRALININADIEDSISKILSITKEDIIELASNVRLIASYFVNNSDTYNQNEEKHDEEDDNE